MARPNGQRTYNIGSVYSLTHIHFRERSGGPTLIWSDIQTSCFDALGDVLLVLDCCNATLFTKGEKLGGKFEVLAACAKNLETPIPGEGSFTWALLKILSSQDMNVGLRVTKLSELAEEHTRGWFCSVLGLRKPVLTKIFRNTFL